MRHHHPPLLSFPDQNEKTETNVISLKAKKLDKVRRIKSFEQEKVKTKQRQAEEGDTLRKREKKNIGSVLGSSMFRGLQAHLKRASNNLAKEKTHLEKQQEVVRKIDEDLKKENLQLKEQKVEQLQKKKEEEIKQKRKLDKRVKSVSNQLTTEIIVSHQKKLATFIKTKQEMELEDRSEPAILWRPASYNSLLQEARKDHEMSVKTKIKEFKEIQSKALERELMAYDKKVEEIEARRQKRQQEKEKEMGEDSEEEDEEVGGSEGEEKEME